MYVTEPSCYRFRLWLVAIHEMRSIWMLLEETKCDAIMQSAQDRNVDIEPAYKLIESYRMLYQRIY